LKNWVGPGIVFSNSTL